MLSPFQSLNLMGSFLILIFLMLMILMMFMYSNNLFTNKIFMSLILSLLIFNLFGLNPYFWCMTSYLWGNLLLSLVIWGVVFISSFFKNFINTISHLLPSGSPIMLWFFLIMLESVSQVIRPVTLSLRLTCNMMAGHVLISMTSNISMISFFIFLMLLIFESGVCLIQSIVFTMLNIIYKKELN